MDRAGGPEVFWDDRADAWNAHAESMEAFSAQFGGPAMDALDLRPGERVLEVGCGPGVSTIELARRVGGDGHATGIDISESMITHSRARAGAAGMSNVHFEVGDVESAELGDYDAIYSRFGVMFFSDPEAAFANLAGSLTPRGRLSITVWGELADNPWMFIPTLLASGSLAATPEIPGPDEPGPFSLADPDRIRTLLAGAGFGDIRIERLEVDLHLDVDTANGAVAAMLAVGPLGDTWVEADEPARSTAVEAVLAGCGDYRSDDGWRLPACALVVRASLHPTARGSR